MRSVLDFRPVDEMVVAKYGAEPSLRELVFKYYHSHGFMDAERASEVARDYCDQIEAWIRAQPRLKPDKVGRQSSDHEAVRPARPEPPPLNPRADAERVPLGSTGMAKADSRTVGLIPATGAKKKRGRPKTVGPKPWEGAGVSRATWFRQKAEKTK